MLKCQINSPTPSYLYSPSSPSTPQHAINIENGDLGVAVHVTHFERLRAIMTVIDRLEILLFQEGRDVVIILLLSRILHSIERIEPLHPFEGIARPARPYLIVDALDLVAHRTTLVDVDGPRHDVLLGESRLC